jgi:TatD DNase family protein
MARQVVKLGFHLGIGGVATFKNSRLLDAIRAVPLERIVLETDCPYLTPHPFRGRRNEPALVRYVAETLALVYKTSPDDVIQRTTDNFFAAMGTEIKPQPPVYKVGETIYIHIVPGADLAQRAVAVGEIADGAADVKEAVICGYDDPLEHLDQVTVIAAQLGRCGIPVRLVVGVRGLVAPGSETVDALSGKVGAITVRMYGSNAAQHEKTANTGRGDAAFESLLDFTARSLGAGMPTECQFMAAPKTKSESCRALTDSLGAGFLIRKFRSL